MNAGSRARRKQLEDELLALSEDTMLLEELDGFIAGLLVCPDLIKPGEWLPIVWNRDGEDSQAAFADCARHSDTGPLKRRRFAAAAE